MFLFTNMKRKFLLIIFGFVLEYRQVVLHKNNLQRELSLLTFFCGKRKLGKPFVPKISKFLICVNIRASSKWILN